MNCNNALDQIYGMEDVLPLRKRFSLAFHIIFCGHCAASLKNYEEARFMLRSDFFPSSPDFSNSIMDAVYHEAFDNEIKDAVFETGGFSTRGWIIAGIVMLLSLSTVFFEHDFVDIVVDYGPSFLLPLGIITGIVITGYGALFIGSHLKEFSERFKL